MSDVFGVSGQILLELFINGQALTIESVIDRQLLDYSLEEYRYYDEKLINNQKNIQTYILKHFPEEYKLLLEILGVKELSTAMILAEIDPTKKPLNPLSTLLHGLDYLLVYLRMQGRKKLLVSQEGINV